MISIRVDNEIKLSEVKASFAPLYASLAKENYEYLCEWLTWPPMVKSEEDFLGFIDRCKQGLEAGTSMTYGIMYQDQLIGNISYKTINRELKKVEIGYWIAEAFQGNGIVTRACAKLIEYAFDSLDMSKVEMCVATENIQSRAVCKRLGMKLEGEITNAECVNGEILDHVIYGVHR